MMFWLRLLAALTVVLASTGCDRDPGVDIVQVENGLRGAVATPDGAVDASATGRQRVTWRVGDQVFPWELASRRNHVPRLLSRILRGDASFQLAPSAWMRCKPGTATS